MARGEQTERPSGQLGHEPARWTLQSADHVIGLDPTGQETLSACSGRRKVVAPTWSTSLGWAGSREGRAERLVKQETEEVERPPGQSGRKPEKWTQSLQPADHITGSTCRRVPCRRSSGSHRRRAVRVKARAYKLAMMGAEGVEHRPSTPRAAGRRPAGSPGSGRWKKRKPKLQQAAPDTEPGAGRRRSYLRFRRRLYRFMSVPSTLDYPSLGSPTPQGVG